VVFLPGCGGNDDAVPSGGLQPDIEITPTAAYRERQAEYLAYCDERNGPGQGGIYGQVCPAYTGSGSYDEEEILRRLDGINVRYGSVNFHLNAILRILYLDRRTPSLPDDLREAMEETVLGFMYWIDEPGPEELVWWSENHQILYHTAELLAGQLFPDTVFSNSGMTGTEHVDKALGLLRPWLEFRGRFGFSEWHSNVYFNEDMPGLINLVDFAEDGGVAARAAILLDIMAFDMACNYFKGLYATTHGRTYPSKLLDGLKDSTHAAAWIMLGLGAPDSLEALSPHHFTGAFLSTSDRYFPPAMLEEIARDAETELEHRQRDSITLEEGPSLGYGFESFQEVMFWWGLTGYVAPQTVIRSFDMVDAYNLWEGGEPWNQLGILKPLVGSPVLEDVALALEPLTRGVVLEAVSTYTYRTPSYQLSGAQDYKPGSWTGQVHAWQATLDGDAYVFTTYPGGLEGDYMGGEWTGGFVPRATLHRNVGVIQYRRPEIPLLDQILFVDYSHAFFPRDRFDEVVESGNWVMGRKGDAYVALFSQHETEWAVEDRYELIARAKENVWIVELGDAGEYESFSRFVSEIESAPVALGESVEYGSPSQGLIRVGWTGPMTVEGVEVDLGPYERWDNRYCRQPLGTTVTALEFRGERLELDFEKPERRLLK